MIRVKKIGPVAVRTLFSVLPRPCVKKLIELQPRLGVAAPPGITFAVEDFLGEFRIAVDIRNCVERAMLRGTYEPANVRVIRENVRPGDCCFDVGANVGGAFFCDGPSGHDCRQSLRLRTWAAVFLPHHITLNPRYKDCIVTENLGISDAEGFLQWAEDPRECGAGNGRIVSLGGTRVPVVSLDSYVETRQVP